MTINFWAFLCFCVGGVLAYKLLELLAFMICTIVACTTNKKSGALDTIMEAGERNKRIQAEMINKVNNIPKKKEKEEEK